MVGVWLTSRVSVMKPFLAINCGAANLKVALFEPQPNGTLVLVRYGVASLGQRGLEEVERTGLLKEVLRDVLDRNEIRAKGLDANVCTPSYQCFTKFLNTPAVDGAKVGQIIEQHLGDADQAGRQLTGTQALGQAARWQKLGLSLDAAGERHGVEVRHGADSLGH